ncbi:speckle-type POZ protein-like [Stegodyphus dumicola]|uniref:speckle-type POZ protein-like n=1 Tax=Stegodyphus dumicola TaxID=202533 RepID=UPI0015AA66A0|nr:speckle-type POZ protein-like [Stegodyphus dumicola]
MWITKLPETEEKVQTLTTFCKVFQDMHAMYRKPEQSDLIIVCEDLEIPVHKCVLSARSPVFAHMFRNVTNESTAENRILITDVEPCVLEKLLQFLCSGWINLSSYSVACDLYYASVKYSVLELKDICREFINSSLSASIVTKTLSLAKKHENQKMLEKALIFVNSEFEDIESTEAWTVISEENQNLEREILCSIIKMRSKNHK